MTDGFLHKYFLDNGNKRLDKWVHYFDIYERHLSRFRETSPVMVEIGVFGGGSLAMWKAFLGEGSRIIGIDIKPECKAHESDGIDIFIGSQDDPALIDQIFSKYPKVDIILDDGSHRMAQTVKSFELMYDRLHPNGLYMVEDTHTSYWPKYGGGLKRQDSFIEFAKGKIDELNAVHTKGALPPSTFTKTTDCIAFYDSIVVFEKRPQGKRQSLITHGLTP